MNNKRQACGDTGADMLAEDFLLYVFWGEIVIIIKAAFADKLPGEILSRGKQGFSVPVGPWLRNELRDWADERLGATSALAEYFQPAAIQHLFDEHQAGRVNHGKKLWALLIFALWLEQYS